jgi:transcriptional antiterminator RfaH
MGGESRILEGELLLPGRTFDDEHRWHVLHTRSRQEKALAKILTGRGVAHFLPLLDRQTYHGQRKVTVNAPIFPGYMFLWGSNDEAYDADRTGKVANLILVTEQERLEWELENLYRALAGKAPLDPTPALRKGVRVVVKAGPFKGLEGVVSNRLGDNRLVLQVEMLGSAVSLEIEGSLLERLD